jgi:hypothetical protein
MSIIVKIIQDDNAESPRTFDNVGVMACWHRRYNLGDVQPKGEDPAEWLKENAPKGSVALPLYLYDHSGITMSTGSFGDVWDSGQVGWIVATPDAIRKNFMVKRITAKMRATVEEILKSEVKIYDHYLTGNVWGYTIESVKDCDSCGHETKGDEDVDDSCWGFFGDDLAFTGIKDHVDAKYHEALEAAWDMRFR